MSVASDNFERQKSKQLVFLFDFPFLSLLPAPLPHRLSCALHIHISNGGWIIHPYPFGSFVSLLQIYTQCALVQCHPSLCFWHQLLLCCTQIALLARTGKCAEALLSPPVHYGALRKEKQNFRSGLGNSKRKETNY